MKYNFFPFLTLKIVPPQYMLLNGSPSRYQSPLFGSVVKFYQCAAISLLVLEPFGRAHWYLSGQVVIVMEQIHQCICTH